MRMFDLRTRPHLQRRQVGAAVEVDSGGRPPDDLATALGRIALPAVAPEWLLLGVSAFFVACANDALWQSVAAAGSDRAVQCALALVLVALHALLLGVLAPGRMLKPVLCAALVATALASWFADRYAVLYDVEMIHNIWHTDAAETRELLSPGLLWHLLASGVAPALLVAWLPVRLPAGPRRFLRRPLFVAAMALLAALALAGASQGLFSLVRSDHALRYRILPGAYLVSTVRALGDHDAPPPAERRPVGSDARQTSTPLVRRPRLLVLVVGETVRADHWGLNGYARDTTPELRRRGVVNFSDTRACGTSTEVSVPCMFSRQGRAHYDRDAIRDEQGLLDVVARTGVQVNWLDNQSGCKGVCAGVHTQVMSAADDPVACADGRCYDAALVSGLRARLDTLHGDALIVLHMLGNHGPAYFERYPAAFEHYTPTCRSADLGRCDPGAIVNAYDNAVRYTDYVLAHVIDVLAAQPDRDAAMLYVSDHGESLGEYGLHLHGAPYAIAPDVQLQVPMVLWAGEGTRRSMGLDLACVGRGARAPHSHDDLFPTVLRFFDIESDVRDAAGDLAAGCRAG